MMDTNQRLFDDNLTMSVGIVRGAARQRNSFGRSRIICGCVLQHIR